MVAQSHDERVLNPLSERIVKADGTPNEAFNRAHLFQITSAAGPKIFEGSVGNPSGFHPTATAARNERFWCEADIG
jgi:hypothetical protein